MALATRGLPVSRLINVSVNLSPAAVPFLNFDTLLIIGASDVIDATERVRSYGSLGEVADDFGTTAPEYLAADLFFSQIPQPTQLYIGRWCQTATEARLYCGPLAAAEQAMASWNAITAGGFKIAVGAGAPIAISGLSFAAAANLNAVAGIIDTALTTHALNCAWNGLQFVFSTTATGAAAAVSFLTAATTGTDISAKLKGTAALAQSNAAGHDIETPLQAVVALDDRSWWYGCMFAVEPAISDSDAIAVAEYLEGADSPHVFGITVADPGALVVDDTASIGALLKAKDIGRTFCQWSSSSAYAVASFFGRAFTVDFRGSNTAITMMWKTEPGVLPEYLSSSQANALDANNYNYLAQFNIGTAIIVNGKMCNGFFFDEIWGTDWLANQVQTDLFNLLYQAPKVPQTDPGVHLLVTTTEGACARAVTNGLLAPGIWQTTGFGQLQMGDFLAKGFYVYAAPVATQPPAERNARKSPLLQVAAKLAGAIHTVDVLINVNR